MAYHLLELAARLYIFFATRGASQGLSVFRLGDYHDSGGPLARRRLDICNLGIVARHRPCPDTALVAMAGSPQSTGFTHAPRDCNPLHLPLRLFYVDFLP